MKNHSKRAIDEILLYRKEFKGVFDLFIRKSLQEAELNSQYLVVTIHYAIGSRRRKFENARLRWAIS